MNEITYYNLFDREGWPAGPWDGEPDRVEWIHDETGVACTARRGVLGSWCGYIGVGENHPAYAKNYNDIDVDVHGGLTYGAKCRQQADDEWIRYRSLRERWRVDALLHPNGDAARHLREDRGETTTLQGYLQWMRTRGTLCHADCRHGLWWLGFDCAHYRDTIPGILAVDLRLNRPPLLLPGIIGTEYRDLRYVIDEVNRLAVAAFNTTKEVSS